jgi:hypothetical protein
VHAEHRDAADVGIDLDLEDVREHVLAGSGTGCSSVCSPLVLVLK